MKKSILWIVGIVAIVALFGIFFMMGNTTEQQTLVVDEQGNVVGQFFGFFTSLASSGAIADAGMQTNYPEVLPEEALYSINPPQEGVYDYDLDERQYMSYIYHEGASCGYGDLDNYKRWEPLEYSDSGYKSYFYELNEDRYEIKIYNYDYNPSPEGITKRSFFKSSMRSKYYIIEGMKIEAVNIHIITTNSNQVLKNGEFMDLKGNRFEDTFRPSLYRKFDETGLEAYEFKLEKGNLVHLLYAINQDKDNVITDEEVDSFDYKNYFINEGYLLP